MYLTTPLLTIRITKSSTSLRTSQHLLRVTAASGCCALLIENGNALPVVIVWTIPFVLSAPSHGGTAMAVVVVKGSPVAITAARRKVAYIMNVDRGWVSL